MLGRMETQYRTFQTTLNEELEQIERAFVEERTELLQSNSSDIEKLFISRRENESKFMEERADRMEDHICQLEQLRIHDAEEYNLVKIKLETDVKVLEQQLQQMRGTYQLNTEKLEYNFQVLKKREEENGTILSAQKRKIARSTDHLNTLKAKISKQEKSFQLEYFALTDDYKRITDQFKELQKKFRHFQIADSKKYRQVWQMNEETAQEKLRKVLQADRIIHEQQLGLEWQAPDEDIFKTAEHIVEKIERRDKEPGAVALLMASTLAESCDDDESGVKETFGLKLTRKGYSKTMKRMLELLCNEAGFLVEERLQKLLSPLHRDEQSLMKLDSILKALGVETIEDIESLTSYFVHKSHHSITDEPSVEEEPKHTLSDGAANLISPNEVVKAIRRYVEDQRSKVVETSRPSTAHDSSTEEPRQPQASDLLQAAPVQPAQNSAKTYWDKFNMCIDNKNYRTWSAVYVGMEKYNQLLSERWQLTQEIGSVGRQNGELRQLLRQYMTAKVNDDLQVPPTRIMLAQAGLLQ